MVPLTPVATYRVQLTPTVGFAEVAARLDHLLALGVSHVYLSPVTEAVPGSTHGYDVVDHTRVRDELGGLDGLVALLDSAAARGMALLVDHVPNHAAVDRAELNRPWWTMLRDGPLSAAARWFDVDWSVAEDRVLLPVLAAPLAELTAAGEVSTTTTPGGGELLVGEHRFPLASGTSALPLDELLDRQHYRLLHWRSPERNVRRFFVVDSLAALRVEHPEVAAAVDTVPRLLADHPAFGGVRVDHVDGLADPGAYLGGLRAAIGERWLLVEKILAPGETLPDSWPVDGTTGYEHARMLEHALLDGAGADAITARWGAWVGDRSPFRAWEIDARREVLAGGLAPDLARVGRIAGRIGVDAEAVAELSVHLRRYRTYLPADPDGVAELGRARQEAATARPDLAGEADRLAAELLDPAGDVELRTRWQQLTGPAAAKGVEDRAFFRYAALPSLGEVGGDPEPAEHAVAALHAHHASHHARWPATLLAGSTHDTKRSEDVRARGLALVADHERWTRLLDGLVADGVGAGIDAGTRWLALQTAVTAAPISHERLSAFLVKAAREAEVHTSWSDPDPWYEAGLGQMAAELARWPPLAPACAALDRPGRAASLALLAVRATAPGVPDLYQGTEGFRFMLVDPDNRIEPDQFELEALVRRARAIDGPVAWAEPGAPAARAVVIRRLLAVRGELPDVFGADGGYLPLPAAEELVAFARLDAGGEPRVVTIVARCVERGDGALVVALPDGRWRDVLADGRAPAEGALDAGALLQEFPAVVLRRL